MQITDFFKQIKEGGLGVHFYDDRIVFDPPLKGRDEDPERWDRVVKYLDEKLGVKHENLGSEQDIQHTGNTS